MKKKKKEKLSYETLLTRMRVAEKRAEWRAHQLSLVHLKLSEITALTSQPQLALVAQLSDVRTALQAQSKSVAMFRDNAIDLGGQLGKANDALARTKEEKELWQQRALKARALMQTWRKRAMALVDGKKEPEGT